MGGDDEFDRLLHERFGIGRDAFVAVLKNLPLVRPWAMPLSARDAQLLDDAGFREGPYCVIGSGTAVTRYVEGLGVSSFTVDDVTTGLDLSAPQVQRMRVAGELWAILDQQVWLFPVIQFDIDSVTGDPVRQVRGLAEVLKALPADLHPVAIEGFLRTPQPDLYCGRAQTPLDWLREGGDIDAVVAIALSSDWYGR
ncbi:hypothetical protein [Mycolicibacterium sp. CBMA 226]|uniref:hypothetical protein n=1 Tax=Mycolicibacterium sp. CBMA 226 TaxID=2606611 RepID=UPI0012DC5988|nr:hypothetical protein [Mycolicibacterium sp. CBMA 226]MUL78962.1 hypothetical protein [Mycolicibacterium sp. CBMA 226]QGW61273.1 hypothetical protein ICEMyc226_00241 [Mycolicibacterium sp.]